MKILCCLSVWLCQVPVEVLLLLTVPVVDTDKEDHNWKRPLNCLHIITGPLVCVLTLQSGKCKSVDIFTWTMELNLFNSNLLCAHKKYSYVIPVICCFNAPAAFCQRNWNSFCMWKDKFCWCRFCVIISCSLKYMWLKQTMFLFHSRWLTAHWRRSSSVGACTLHWSLPLWHSLLHYHKWASSKISLCMNLLFFFF